VGIIFFLDNILNEIYTVVKSGKRWEGKLPGFSGKYYYTLDAKGRLIIPAPFREILSSNYSAKLIFTNDVFDRCLRAYPVNEWNKLIEKIGKEPQSSDAVKYYMRRVIAPAIECEIDRQGRVLIPSALRTDAGLNNEVVLMGMANVIEVWDRKELEQALDSSKIDKKAYKEELANRGL